MCSTPSFRVAKYWIRGALIIANDGGMMMGTCKAHPTLLFRQIAAINPDVTGIDIDSVGIEHLLNRHYNVICDNVETMSLGRTFDVIVAGEIIEHLENPGLFSATC